MNDDLSCFQFEIVGSDPQIFEVLCFSSTTPHSLSQDYMIEIEILNPHSVDLCIHIGSRAKLVMEVSDYIQMIHGVIADVQIYGLPELKGDRIMLASPLHPLKVMPRSTTYRGMSVVEIVEKILQRAGWELSTYAFVLSQSYTKRDFVLQYQETDYDFLVRILNFHGLFFAFQQQNTHAVLYLTDHLPDLSAPMGTIGIRGDQFYDTQVHYDVLPVAVHLCDYNEEAPHQPLRAQACSKSSTPGWGEQYRVLDHFTTQEEGYRLAHVRMASWDCQRNTWHGKVNHVLHSGMQIEIQDHTQANRNGFFSVISVSHRGNQDPEVPGLRYQAEVIMIPAAQPYCVASAPSFFMPPCSAKTLTLDEQGRYTIKHEYDEPEAVTSGFAIPRVQLLTGENYGMHFPYPSNTEVLLLHINGDPDRPVIFSALLLGNFYCDSSHAALKSHAGNILHMEDYPFPRILLGQTEDHGVRLSDHPSGIALLSRTGSLTLNSATDLILTSAETVTHCVGDTQEVTIAGNSIIDSSQGDIQLSSGHHLTMIAAQQKVEVSQNAMLCSDEEMRFATRENMVWHVQEKIHCVAGHTLSIDSAGHLSLSTSNQGDLLISHAGAKIEISQGNIGIYSPEAIHMDCDHIEIKGTQHWSGRGQVFPEKQNHFKILIQDDTGFPWDRPLLYTLYQGMDSHPLCKGITLSEIHAELPSPQETLKIETPGSCIVAIENEKRAPHFQRSFLIKSEQQQIKLTCLRENRMLQTGELLEEEMLRYFQRKGNNVTLFIHGFNVAQGRCGREFTNATVSTDLIPQRARPDQWGAPASVYFSCSPYPCSILRTWEDVRTYLPQVPARVTNINGLPCFEENVRDTFINGTGAYQWMQHVGYNLNCAAVGTYPFPWETRGKEYTPILTLSWPGNVGLVHFKTAIANAVKTGKAICRMLSQLKNAGLTIHVIAHSLGCRVLLEAMQYFASEGHTAFFEHIFLWQAAIPNDALSTEFKGALASSKRITLLYSDHDLVLGLPYHAGQADVLHLQALLQGKPALGYTGPIFDRGNPQDPLWPLIQQGRVLLAPQSEWLTDHSGMKIPNLTLFENIYKGTIVGGNGLRKFGQYAL